MTTDQFHSGFRNILDAISDGVYVTTADRQIVFWSRGAERLTEAVNDVDVRGAMYVAKHGGEYGFVIDGRGRAT